AGRGAGRRLARRLPADVRRHRAARHAGAARAAGERVTAAVVDGAAVLARGRAGGRRAGLDAADVRRAAAAAGLVRRAGAARALGAAAVVDGAAVLARRRTGHGRGTSRPRGGAVVVRLVVSVGRLDVDAGAVVSAVQVGGVALVPGVAAGCVLLAV